MVINIRQWLITLYSRAVAASKNGDNIFEYFWLIEYNSEICATLIGESTWLW